MAGARSQSDVERDMAKVKADYDKSIVQLPEKGSRRGHQGGQKRLSSRGGQRQEEEE